MVLFIYIQGQNHQFLYLGKVLLCYEFYFNENYYKALKVEF